MCRVLHVSRSGYYIYDARPRSQRAIDDEALSKRVATIFDTSDGIYGAPRFNKELRTEGTFVSRHRVARLMREMRLSASPRKKFVVTTDSKHHHPVAPNVLNREFTATAPNQKSAGDITYIATREGWLFQAVFLDLFSRRVIGWAMGPTYDNAVVESFFATLKKERVYREKYVKRRDTESRIFQYIEGFYNPRRLHSTLAYASPNAYERAWDRDRSVSPTEETPTLVNPSEGMGFSTVGGVPTGCDIMPI